MRILLAQSDADELDITAYALHRQGFYVLTTADGKAAIAKWRSENPDLILLETSLPRMNGLEACRLIREESQVPVMFLSEKRDDHDIVAAFNAGADDYVVKPFSINQLVVRIRAILRRVASTAFRSNGVAGAVAVGNLVIDAEQHRAVIGGEAIHLTPLEFRLLYYLAANNGRVISTDQLIDYAWGVRDGGDASVLKTHISRIRQKLETWDVECVYINNVSGFGYCLDA